MSMFHNQLVKPIYLHKLSRNVAMHHVTKHAKDVTVTKVLQNSTPKETIWTWISTRMITQLDSQIGETLIARALPLNMYNYQKQGGQRGYKGHVP